MTQQSCNLLYRSAQIYASKFDIPVFPTSTQKIPLVDDWYHQASTDLSIIEQWWTKWPDANVSMPTGSASALIVLDVDVKNGQPGFESLREIEMKYGELPQTPASISPSGGQHYFFKYDGPAIGRRIRFMPGLDLMAEDSQVLLPPSIGQNGKRYTWEVAGRIDEVEFAPLPCWLTELAHVDSPNEMGSTVTTSSYWKSLVTKGAQEGERNQSVAKLAGHLLRRYVDPYLTLEFVRLWNRTRNSPPLPDEEVVTTVNSIAGKEKSRRCHQRGAK